MANKKKADSQLKKDHPEQGSQLQSDEMEKAQGEKKEEKEK